MSERGLRLSDEKTGMSTHVQDGFDFLGQNVRRQSSSKVLLKPSKPEHPHVPEWDPGK